MVRATIVAILTVTMVLAACGDDGGEGPLDINGTACNQPEPSPPEVEGETFTTAGGVQVIIITAGEEDPSQAGDAVAVHYAGWLTADGTLFASSLINCEPFAFALGRGDVIAGWDEGIVGMSPGDIRRLIVPAELGYGAQGSDNVPPNAVLTYDIELIAFGRQTDQTPTP